jgi:hypothetical protein
MKLVTLTLAAAFLISAAVAQSQANVIVTYAESPGAETSSLPNTFVYDFNSLPTNQVLTNVTWTGVGTFNQLLIKPADQYGGAGGSNYSVQGINSSVLTTTLTLNTPSAYFGIWWSAGDSKNVLQFYSGSTLMAQFTTASLLAALPSSYYGNPSGPFAGQNSNEPYAFINFFADSGTTWDKVVFSNNGSSGFESDNYTDRTEAWDPLVDGPRPGVPLETISGTNEQVIPAPEPATWAGLCMALGGIAYLKRNRRKS